MLKILSKPFNFHLTEVGISFRIHRLIVFYSVDPHCFGFRIWRPERTTKDWGRIWKFYTPETKYKKRM